MKPNRKTIQFILLSLGVLLIFGTYIFYPKFNKTIDEENLVEKKKKLQLTVKNLIHLKMSNIKDFTTRILPSL